MSEAPHTTIDYLSGKFGTSTPILLTGAGFSLDAKDMQGVGLPSSPQLAQELWPFCDLAEAFDPQASLQEIYQVALRNSPAHLKEFLQSRFRVDPRTLPEYYQFYFASPWNKIYTLNIDDLALAASIRFKLPRKPIPISGVIAPRFQASDNDAFASDIRIIHLHGTLHDVPDRITFSTAQYAERAKGPDIYYATLVSELLLRPFVFVGTRLDEAPLWQHIEMRRGRGAKTSELRPKSYLVCPTLSAARRAMLREYNVTWLDMDAQEFATKVLQHLSLAGSPATARQPRAPVSQITLVASIPAAAARIETEYLLGQEPQWSDIVSGRAITRDIDGTILSKARSGLATGRGVHVLVLAGTAGSGKSTSLLRLALALSNDGLAVGYCDREDNISAHALVQACQSQCLQVLAIDDGARYGESLAKALSYLASSGHSALVVVSMRAAAVERVLPGNSVRGAGIDSVVLPGLTDSDIDAILDTLTWHNRLGKLTNKSRSDQVRAFREQAGRQLLVAMIQATSGDRFEDKITNEMEELTPEERHLYALVAVATGRDFSISMAEILLAYGEGDNASMNLVRGLQTRGLLVHPKENQNNYYRVRHREIARVLTDHFVEQGDIRNLVEGLAFAAASMVAPGEARESRSWRFLKAFISHKYLNQLMGVVDARLVYASLEGALNQDYHFWLQRGALEVKQGDLNLARHFLDSARGLNSTNPLVVTEWAYLEMRIAITSPRAPGAFRQFAEAIETLEGQIAERGDRDSYPYHLIGSQSLAWARLQVEDRDAVRDRLRRAVVYVKEGKQRHPGSRDLEGLEEALNKELLTTYI